MVRGILDGRKTATRRLPSKRIRDKWFEYDEWVNAVSFAGCLRSNEKEFYEAYPPYQVGDVLYVRETWCWCPCWDCGHDSQSGCVETASAKFYNNAKKEYGCYGYKASFGDDEQPFDRWYPSICMPKEAARIWLKVMDVRVERLQDITEKEAIAEVLAEQEEGTGILVHDIREYFGHRTWDSAILKEDLHIYGWDANPWVWVIEFERIEKPDDN